MLREEIFEKLKGIIVEQLGVEESVVNEDATFMDDLSADSLDIVELVMSIEEEFDLEIPDQEAEKIVKVSDVVEVSIAINRLGIDAAKDVVEYIKSHKE